MNNKPHGKGVYIFALGDRYEGEINQGLKNGYGRYYYTNGDSYEGFW